MSTIRSRRFWYLLAALFLIPVIGVGTALATGIHPGITPDSVEALVFPGESYSVTDKTVHTPAIPPKLDVCLLEDETASFGDDIGNLQNPVTSKAIYDGVTLQAPDSQFAVAGFRDYPVDPYGSPGDWVYRRLSGMDPTLAVWQAGINALTAGGGNDLPEAQYDAIVAAAGPGSFNDPTLGSQPDCGWRADPDVTRVLVVATDAFFHTPDGTHVNDEASTIAALTTQDIRLIGLKAPGTNSELDNLAAATGGSVQPLSSDGSNIATAILAGLANLPADTALVSTCAVPLSTSFTPPSQIVTSGDDAVFVEDISVASGAAGGDYTCYDSATINGGDMVDSSGALIKEQKLIHVPGIDAEPETKTNELGFDLSHTVTATVSAGTYGPVPGVRVEIEVVSGPNTGEANNGLTDAAGQFLLTYTPPVAPASLGTDTIEARFTDAGDTVVYGTDTVTKDWVDTTPPTAACDPTMNPSGNNEPRAPGKGGKGQNQDGFYLASAEDVVWPADQLQVYITDNGSGTVFGPFPVGVTFKYTQDPSAVPEQKTMGGGPADYINWHIIGNGDAVVTAVDGSGNTSAPVYCLVPPPPQ